MFWRNPQHIVCREANTSERKQCLQCQVCGNWFGGWRTSYQGCCFGSRTHGRCRENFACPGELHCHTWVFTAKMAKKRNVGKIAQEFLRRLKNLTWKNLVNSRYFIFRISDHYEWMSYESFYAEYYFHVCTSSMVFVLCL